MDLQSPGGMSTRNPQMKKHRRITISTYLYTPPSAGGGCRAGRQSLDFCEICLVPRGRRYPRLGRATPGRDPHPGGAWLAAYAGTLAGAVQPVRPCGPAHGPGQRHGRTETPVWD